MNPLSDNYIQMSRRSPAYKELEDSLTSAKTVLEGIALSNKPELMGERYMNGKQVMEFLHISPRTLQTYRDTWLLPYTTIGGTILYPVSKICEVLERNYYKSPK